MREWQRQVLVVMNWDSVPQEPQTGTQILTEVCGFITIVIGTFLLHATRELDVSLSKCSLPVI